MKENWNQFITKENYDQRKKVLPPSLTLFPFCCMGYVRCPSPLGKQRTSTGFLISNALVLTSAYQFIEQSNGNVFSAKSCSFHLHYKNNGIREFRIEQIKINQQYRQLRQEINRLKNSFEPSKKQIFKMRIIEMLKKSASLDFALLRLSQKVQMPEYFHLSPNFTGFNNKTKLTVAGYSISSQSEQPSLWVHSNSGIQIQGKFVNYDIDTDQGQSGSPVYQDNKVIAIHTGYNPEKKLNFGPLITSEVIGTLERWCLEMNHRFQDINIKEIKEHTSKDTLFDQISQKDSTILDQKVILSTFKIKKQMPNISAKKFPYNCVVDLVKKSTKNQSIIGTGFLIGDSFILTSASIVYQNMNWNTYQKNLQTLFTSIDGKTVQIKDYRIHPKFLDISKQILAHRNQKLDTDSPMRLKKKKSEMEDLLREQCQLNYCLLKTSEAIKFPNYFVLNQDGCLAPNSVLTIAGYQKISSSFAPGYIKVIDVIGGSIYYDMDGAECQSGSPIFEEKTGNLVGIHQGFSREEESSYGTMVGSKVIDMLEQWCFEMTPQFTATN